MIAPQCTHESYKRSGKHPNGRQRYKCKSCGKRFIRDEDRPLGEMRTDVDRAAMALSLLLEGMSIRACERITQLHRDTICNLILTVGANCERYMDSLEGVRAEDIQCDEIWSFVRCKQRNARDVDDGDSWLFIGVERNTKMILAYREGDRSAVTCDAFLAQLDKATRGQRVQVSTDGLASYTHGVPFAMGGRVDFGQLVKQYASSQEQTRYSPAVITSAEKRSVFGAPDPDRICTSHIERLNLTIRMQLRRFTRLTNGHSKSREHHRAMFSIFVVWYNWVRRHQSLRGRTPAMASGLIGRPLTVREMISEVSQ